MLLHGDELGRTQQGNNNVYCQDNELAWVDWDRARDYEVLTGFVAKLADLRREHPVFRRRRFFDGRHDIGWYRPTGERMAEDDWDTAYAKSLSVFLNGEAIREPDSRGEPVSDEPFWLLINGAADPVVFVVPDLGSAESWDVVLDTAAPLLDDVDQRTFKTGGELEVAGRSILLLRKAF
jgi:glycogen operon protein